MRPNYNIFIGYLKTGGDEPPLDLPLVFIFADEVNVDHRITSDMLHELRECVLSQQWAKALQILPSLSKVPYSPSETIWRVRTSCPEVINFFHAQVTGVENS